jgi:hypothetical protein
MFWLAVIIVVISRLFSVPLLAAAIGTIGVVGGLYLCALFIDAQRRRPKTQVLAAPDQIASDLTEETNP